MMTNMLELGYTKSLQRETYTFGCRKPPHLAAENLHIWLLRICTFCCRRCTHFTTKFPKWRYNLVSQYCYMGLKLHIWRQKTSTFGCRKYTYFAAENVHILQPKFQSKVIIWFHNIAISGQTYTFDCRKPPHLAAENIQILLQKIYTFYHQNY